MCLILLRKPNSCRFRCGCHRSPDDYPVAEEYLSGLSVTATGPVRRKHTHAHVVTCLSHAVPIQSLHPSGQQPPSWIPQGVLVLKRYSVVIAPMRVAYQHCPEVKASTCYVCAPTVGSLMSGRSCSWPKFWFLFVFPAHSNRRFFGAGGSKDLRFWSNHLYIEAELGVILVLFSISYSRYAKLQNTSSSPHPVSRVPYACLSSSFFRGRNNGWNRADHVVYPPHTPGSVRVVRSSDVQ